MLRVTIHAGELDTATRFTQRARVDISYDKLAPIADYKTVLFQSGFGASVPASIYKYPRWSASLWDLSARSIALGLRTDFERLNEELPYFENQVKRFAFAPKMCALVEHAAPAGQSQRTLARVEIMQVRRLRGTYVACFEEHTMARHVTEPFVFRPAYLRAAELARACHQSSQMTAAAKWIAPRKLRAVLS